MLNSPSDIIVHTNEYQTPITREFLDSMPKEVGDEFMDIVTNIPFVKRMISPDRKRAKDLERDSFGRIIVDVTDPHILEDMDYFRPAARFYEENGCYTFLKPNKNKGSEFQKWFQEEKRRCLEGYVRESDGEWVTGYMYFYLNYALIKLNRQSERTGVWHQIQHLPDFWEGVYYGFHALQQARLGGKHLIELARRGASKSYRIATIMLHNLTLGEDEEFQTDVNSILTAYTKEYLSEKDGTLSKFEIMRSYLALNTEFKRAMLKQAPSEMIWRQGYKDSMGIAHSTNNIVLGLSVKDDESKIRGKRGMIFFEEMGAFPNLKDVYMNVMDSVKDGDNVFSLLYLVGTAGDAESDFSGARLLLYNPESFGLLALNNVWSFPGKGTDKFGFFFPAYISRSGCMDKDGNSDVTKAIRAILMSLDEVKRSGDMGAYIKRKAELCITPEDALLKVKANFFPVPEINERLRQLDSNPHIYDDIYIGELVDTGKEVVFRSTDDVPIRRWKVDNTTPGALEIYEMPVKGKDGLPMPNRYIIGNDPVDNDRAESSSLSSTFVLDLATDRIVAEYTGRKDYADKNYQILYNLAKFYNAKILYEANKKGTYAYFARRSATYMLADCPAYLKQRNLVKYSTFGSAAHPYTEKVYTPDGIKQWGDIRVGDRLFAPDGTYTTVLQIPFDRVCDIYELSLRDGRKVRASEDHIWCVCKGARSEKRSEILMTTKELLDDLAYTRTKTYVNKTFAESKYYIEKNAGVSYPEQQIPLDPYLLGLLLGDGCMSNIKRCCGSKAYFTAAPSDMEEYAKILGLSYTTIDDRHHWIDIPGWSDIIYLLKLDNTTSRTKYIPDCYKYNTREVRLSILRGLLDTDGSIKREGGTPMYFTTSEQLALDVLEVTRSIGINCSLTTSTNKFGSVYNIRFYTQERMFNLARKYEKQRKVRCRDRYTSIVDIKKIGRAPAKCVTVDREDGLYLIGEFITTHNSKGVTVNAGVKSAGLEMMNTWLQKTFVVDVRDEQGQVHQEEQPILYTIRNRALLEEMASFTPGDNQNYDRISAMIQVMLYREEFIILYGDSMGDTAAPTVADDPFFDKDWQAYKARQK